MTNTLHRQGTTESLKNDYIIFAHTAKGITREGSAAKLQELMQADIGISINISGLLDEVQACCRRAGTERHSAEHSLGFWGAKDRLPEREILEFNTLCGHGMVSFNLIRKMIEYVKLRRLTPRKAARIMAKCCECGAFNPVHAEMLLEKVKKGEKFARG